MDRLGALEGPRLPLHIARAVQAADAACSLAPSQPASECHSAAISLADALTCHVAAVAVAQYSQALYTGAAQPDPTLNRSLRALKRVLPGQWLLWAARSLEATPNGPVEGLREWYLSPAPAPVASAYEGLRRVMVDHLAYTGEYGPRDAVSPRTLLEMVDQYRVRRAKSTPGVGKAVENVDSAAAAALLPGLLALVESAAFLSQYDLYAPEQRRVLMGTKPFTPAPPLDAPAGAEASILIYPPAPNDGPLFPLDPMLAYVYCFACDDFRVAALAGVEDGIPTYTALDPACPHSIRLGAAAVW